LDKLVESNLALKAAAQQKGSATPLAAYDGWATEEAAGYAASAVVDPDSGRYMVDITLSGKVSVQDVTANVASAVPSFSATAVDNKYRGVGIIEGLVSVDDVPALAKVAGVRGVFLVNKPELDSLVVTDQMAYSPRKIVPSLRELTKLESATNSPSLDAIPGQVLKKLGLTFDQGVLQHRVDQINQYYNSSAPLNFDGNGISIGAMSDSFNTRTAAPHAADNVASFDLPGSASNPLNTKPVVVLIDDPAAGTDEGRGMIQNIYKMAPRARIAYCTGVTGEVAFANYIRAMAGIPVSPAPFPNPPAGDPNGVFKADVICDDISYGGEPFFGESIIGNGIDDAFAVGVSYFSSAGNNIGINAYESPLRIIPNGSGNTAATNTALVGTNIDLTGVPAALYSAFAGELVRSRTFRRRYAPERFTPSGVLMSSNTILYERQLEEYYCTLCYALFDLKRRVVTIANSGLPYPVRSSGETVGQVEIPGIPLGLFAGSTYDELTFDLAPGDVFVFCTDGVFEANDALGREFGADRLLEVVTRLHARGVRVSLFVDASPEPIRWAASLGADRVELYTEPFARAFEHGPDLGRRAFAQYADVARLAHVLRLGVNAGHDLDLANLIVFRALPHLDEVSIGHALMSRALYVGLATSVGEYLRVLAAV
jgi:hypothetical protein